MTDKKPSKSGRRRVKAKGRVDLGKYRKSKIGKDICESGPITKRKCTNPICCLIFFAFLCAYGYFFVDGLTNGDPMQLLTPYDEDGKRCGYDTGRTNTPKLFLYKMGTPSAVTDKSFINASVCVDKCPTQTDTLATQGITCVNAGSGDGATCSSLPGLETTAWFKNFCLIDVTFLKTLGAAAQESFGIIFAYFENTGFVQQFISDITAVWWVILVGVGITFIGAWIYMLFVRLFAGCITWGLIFIFLGSIGVGAYLSFDYVKTQETLRDDMIALDANADVAQLETKIKIMRIVAWTVAVIGGILFLVMLCLCHKIQQVIQVIKTAAICVKDVKTMLFVPVITGLLTIVFAGVWAFGFSYLWTSGTQVQSSTWPRLSDFEWDQQKEYVIYGTLFAALWIIAFILMLGDFVIAASACIWYFNQGTSKKEGVKPKSISPVYTGYKWALRYHFGSIALAAFILAIVWAIRIIMAYIHKKLKDSGATKNNKFLEYVMACVHCCLACFERFIRFMNKQGFIYMAISGEGFITSCAEAFLIVIRHAFEFLLLAGLGHLFMYLGIIVMITLPTVAVYFILETEQLKNQINSPLGPLVLVAVIAYFVSKLFVSIYNIVSYAILHCFLLNMKLVKENGGKPVGGCPKPLKKFIKLSKDAEKANEKSFSVSGSFDSNGDYDVDYNEQQSNGMRKDQLQIQ